MIPESFIQELLNRVDIVDVVDKSVPLKKAGANYSACCPFHNEKSPSFTVSPTKQFYHCFGCGAHGSAIGFVMEYQGLTFVESIHELAKMVGMTVPQEVKSTADTTTQSKVAGLQEALQLAAQYYKSELKKSTRAIEYLKARGVSGAIAAKYQIGYAPAGWQNLQAIFSDDENEALIVGGLVVKNEQGRIYDRFRDRIMFPIHNQKGLVIGFGGRIINPEDTPKYYNSPETPLFQKGHELYGLFAARRAIRDTGRALVVEGYMDVVALAQYGIEYSVAALGTATTPFHITKLMRQTQEVVFCFDGDSAGRNAAWRAAMNALPVLTDGLKLSFLFLPKEHDPDSYVREFGKEKFEAEIKAAKPLSKYLIDFLSLDNGLNYAEDAGKFWEAVKPIITQVKAPILAHGLREQVARLVGMPVTEMLKLIDFKEQKIVQPKSRPKLTRDTLPIKKKFIIFLILHPTLVIENDAQYADGQTLDDQLIREIVHFVLKNPNYRPAAILQYLSTKFDIDYIQQIEAEINLFDEKIDQALVIQGFRTHLQMMLTQKKNMDILLDLQGKPFNQLTIEEREILKKLTSKQ